MADTVFAPLLGADPPDFALLHRPRSGPAGRIELLLGAGTAMDRLADVPLPDGSRTLVVLPYRQLAERGLACHDDGTPLLHLPVCRYRTVPVEQALESLPRNAIPVLHDGRFDLDDEAYADLVRRLVAEAIGRGEGANFVLRRAYRAVLSNHRVRTALTVFRRLLAAERGAYWTFLVHCAGRTLVGASPERHVSLRSGTVTMNPVSGTYRYPPGGPTTADLLRFLADRKEAEELYMVVDEELKTLGRLCPGGARLTGPRLTGMAHLAHTEYTVTGRTPCDVREVLRETMFAPTVIGSPLANACRVVARYEGSGRGYYGGVVALVEARGGHRTLDSAILIRTAELGPDRVELGVGATLVRRSDPAAEAAETRAKAAGMLAAIGARPGDTAPGPAGSPLPADARVRRALAARNDRLNGFWCGAAPGAAPVDDARRVLIVDSGDAFTAMLAHLVRACGPSVTVADPGGGGRLDRYHLVVVGPGPGDPRNLGDPRIAGLRALTGTLLARRIPLLAVCLGHQVLAGLLGLRLRRRPAPAQGEQREIDFFGRIERVGFYNTFAAYAGADTWPCAPPGDTVSVCRDRTTGEVYGLRAPAVRSVQFHPESILTERGGDLVRDLMTALLDVPAVTGRRRGVSS